jgi:glycosyltransferase involved in cell wall biosynthesis
MNDPARRLNVLCYIGSLEPGGAERQVVEILKHLDRSRFTPHLCLANRRGELLPEVPSDVPVAAFGDGFEGTWKARLARLTKTTRFLRHHWLARKLRQWDIDVIYDRTYLATLDAAAACWWRPTPRLSAAVADPAVQFAMYARTPRRLWWWFSRRAYGSAAMVLANSAGLREQLLNFWQLPPDRVGIQSNAIDFDRIDALATAPLPKPPDDRFRMLTVGRVDRDKGHADLLSAIETLVRKHGLTKLLWQIVGTGPEAWALEQAARRRGLSEHVQFMGVVANPFPYYRAADVFCLPSRTEGLPNVLIEALACETPVIAADCLSGPREILDGGRYGELVPVRDPSAWEVALLAHREHPAVLQQAAKLGRQSVRDRFAAARVIANLEDLLSAAAQSSRKFPRNTAESLPAS